MPHPCRAAPPPRQSSLWSDTFVPSVTLVGHLRRHTAAAQERRTRHGARLPALPPGPCMPGSLRRGLIGPGPLGSMPQAPPAWPGAIDRAIGEVTDATLCHATRPRAPCHAGRACRRPLRHGFSCRGAPRVHARARSGMGSPAEGRRNPCRRPRRHGFVGPWHLGSMPKAPPAWPGAINRETCEVTDGPGAAVTRRGLVINRAIGEVTVVTVLLSHRPPVTRPLLHRAMQKGGAPPSPAGPRPGAHVYAAGVTAPGTAARRRSTPASSRPRSR